MRRSSLGFTAQNAKLRNELIRDHGFTRDPHCGCGKPAMPGCNICAECLPSLEAAPYVSQEVRHG